MQNIKLAILFGSQARGAAGKRSDTDIAVLAENPLSMRDRSEMAQKFARNRGVSEDDIDLADLRDAPPLLQYQVAEHGRLLYGSENDFLRFRVLAWKRYLDTAKFRRIRSERLKQYADAK